ncbi:unnamed protein product, partial [Rotaria sordida]
SDLDKAIEAAAKDF